MGYSLLTEHSVKMEKSAGFGFYSVVLHLEPNYLDKATGINTCAYAGQCIAYCLANGGRMRFDGAVSARVRRTQWYFEDRFAFLCALVGDISAAQRKAEKMGVPLTVRLNGTSDLEWENGREMNGRTIIEMFPAVQFIDYTKNQIRALRSVTDDAWPKNYKLVYSVNEKSEPSTIRTHLKRGGNVAVVFDVKRGAPLPESHSVLGEWFQVVDGDHSDLRHLDPAGTVIGLRYKYSFASKDGKALKAKKGFIVLQ